MRHRRLAGGAMVSALAMALVACSSVNGGDPGTGSTDGGSSSSGGAADGAYVVVVKATGIGWFDRMEVGVNEWADETGMDAREEGPSEATNEGQVAIIQDLIAQQPTAISVVPNDLAGLESVLKQAQDAGIVVVSHEAVGIKNVDIDIEGFENKAYGAQIMENLGECTGGEGQYVQFVGRLTNGSHSEWVQGAYEKQQADFPDMTRVEDPIESEENEEVAYNKAKELLAKYPDIKAFQGSAGTDVVGIGRAVEEAGKTDSICVMGTSIPSVAKGYLDSGAIDKIFFWDPAMAGKAQLAVAKILAEGGTIEEGTDLGVPGYESLVKLDGADNAYAGDAGVAVDLSNVDQYNF
ncbi:substrate-binding domain-containing protein [Isoptericola sp. b441]|uniref:Substrate-binding domain-containing protein n=1 Tax=Actinotalea lenta TaxID=3064654 RepID=A0ABT9DBW0_9CELL|nr:MULTISPECIES: substrate-binding domain-containing protein [unclassified Isoptericola]MDO8108346.1 substrate-binding domain-containing protein [Isoptericola sp. b441]MDO8119745.1 substrate-binding domain-containing protein [Isoptericola sp. b490]